MPTQTLKLTSKALTAWIKPLSAGHNLALSSEFLQQPGSSLVGAPCSPRLQS